MLIEVKVPPLAESVTDATLVKWHKNAGESVKRGETLIDLETDKVTLEVPAPGDGVLTDIIKQNGETAIAGDILAIVDTDIVATPSDETTSATEAPPQVEPAGANKLSPAVRKVVAENQLDSTVIPATGKGGRLTKADVIDYLDSQKETGNSVTVETNAVMDTTSGERSEERVPMTRLRRKAAERLLQAQQRSALLTTFNEVNMQPIMSLRERYQQEFEKKHGIKLGYMSFFTKAAVEGLKLFPIINASVDEDDIIYHGYFDLGIAVSAPRGLVVPIVRDADQLSLAQLEQKIRQLGDAARDSTLTIEDLTGGTFTITNGGIFGSLLSTPIINPPQSAILGMHRIQERPIAENGQVVIRPMMYLSVSYDHRIIDGREAVQFLVTIKEQLEDPARMLIEV